MEKKKEKEIVTDKDKPLKENNRLIPINISLVKNIFTIPKQNEQSIIYINDIETLNESSLTNNIDQNSIRYNQNIQNDSLNLSHSNKSPKTKTIIRNINQNYLKSELIEQVKENLLLKKEIFKLREEINLVNKKCLELNHQEKYLEKIILDMKKENQNKIKLIEKLKNDNKTKDFIINSFQEKIIIKNQIIDKLRIKLKSKENQVKELNRKLKIKLELNHNHYFNFNETYWMKSTSKNKQRQNSGNKTTTNKKLNKTNSKEKISPENQRSNDIFKLQYYHSNTPKENNKNLYFSEISNNFQKIVSLKKRSNSKNPILFPPKSNNIIKENKENTYSGKKLRYHSYSNKINENSIKSKEKSKNGDLKCLKQIFILQGKKNEDAFIKRFSKNKNQNQNLKNNTYISPEIEYNKRNYRIDIPKLSKRSYLGQKNKIIKRILSEENSGNKSKINRKNMFSNILQKNNSFVKKPKIKMTFLYNNSLNESNSLLNNNNFTTNSIKLFENNSNISKKNKNNSFKF